MEASLRAPFIIRWPGKIPAGRVSNDIVHIVDMYPMLARVASAEVPKDGPIDGIDQLDFFLGKQENSNREGFPAYVADRLCSEVAQLEGSTDLAGEHVRSPGHAPRAEDRQSSH
jgi:hypothetical protein